MRHLKTLLTGTVVIALLCAGTTMASAQEQAEDSGKVKPAARVNPLLIGGDQNPSGDQDSGPSLQSDMRPLTGVQNPTLGSPEMRHSYWVPGFQFSNIVRSTALNQTTASGWNSTSYVTGNVSLLEAWSHSQLALNYTGGGFFSTDISQGRGSFHQFGLNQNFAWRRWQLAFLDQFSYLPEASFGFGGGTSISIPGVGGSLGPPLPGLLGNFQPNQTIFWRREISRATITSPTSDITMPWERKILSACCTALARSDISAIHRRLMITSFSYLMEGKSLAD